MRTNDDIKTQKEDEEKYEHRSWRKRESQTFEILCMSI
jgi:hypothetical protein